MGVTEVKCQEFSNNIIFFSRKWEKTSKDRVRKLLPFPENDIYR